MLITALRPLIICAFYPGYDPLLCLCDRYANKKRNQRVDKYFFTVVDSVTHKFVCDMLNKD